MYLNAYVSRLQYERGVAAFFRHHRGRPGASSALMDLISKAFVAAIDTFVAAQGVPLIDRDARRGAERLPPAPCLRAARRRDGRLVR